jgi:hypothetical protein
MDEPAVTGADDGTGGVMSGLGVPFAMPLACRYPRGGTGGCSVSISMSTLADRELTDTEAALAAAYPLVAGLGDADMASAIEQRMLAAADSLALTLRAYVVVRALSGEELPAKVEKRLDEIETLLADARRRPAPGAASNGSHTNGAGGEGRRAGADVWPPITDDPTGETTRMVTVLRRRPGELLRPIEVLTALRIPESQRGSAGRKLRRLESDCGLVVREPAKEGGGWYRYRAATLAEYEAFMQAGTVPPEATANGGARKRRPAAANPRRRGGRR